MCNLINTHPYIPLYVSCVSLSTKCCTTILCFTRSFYRGKVLNKLLIHVVVVVVDSHIQRIVLATEETTVTQQVSHRPINANPACGHKEVRRSTGHIMVTTRYSDQQGSKSRQKVMRLYKQWHRPISKRFIKPPYSIREQPRPTRNVVAYPRPAFSAKNRKNYAPTSFDQQVQVSQGHTFCTEIRKIEIPRSMVVEALNW